MRKQNRSLAAAWEEIGGKQSPDAFDADTALTSVIHDPAFGNFGRLLFPVRKGYCSGTTLGSLRYIWYAPLHTPTTLAIVNTLRQRSRHGERVFFDLYSEAEQAADPTKRETGLFYFRGKPNGPFAICCAGGGFAYVGAMQDSFPHALALSRQGIHAFALIYRPGAQSGCEDLARAIDFIFRHAKELMIDTEGYSLWGGSAGARLAAWLGSYGPGAFGTRRYPRPCAVILQYTGHSECSPNDPPTFAVVGEEDWIADWHMMRLRMERLSALGIPVEFHHYPGLSHGFGLGEGTIAQGWIEDAVRFWKEQRSNG